MKFDVLNIGGKIVAGLNRNQNEIEEKKQRNRTNEKKKEEKEKQIFLNDYLCFELI